MINRPATDAGSARRVTWPLAGMMLTQTAAAMTLAAVPVLAPEIARDTGVDASAVGAFTALVFGAAMLTSALSGTLIERLGAVHANQAVLLASALALLVTLHAKLHALALSAVLVGAGYGPNTPTGSQVLARVTPPHMRGIVFSVKQSGAPLGAMLAGLVLPAVAVRYGWQAAIVTASALVLAAAAAVEPLRRRLDRLPAELPAGARPSPLAAMRAVLATVALRRLTAAAFVLMILHTCFQTFTVAFLVEHAGLELTVAGGLFALLAVCGSVARVALGWIADRAARAGRVLVITSLAGAAAAAVFATFSGGWSMAAMATACAAAGAASAGWYGVFLAEVARQAPAGRVGLATGGALFFVYSSIVAGPLMFTAAVAFAGSWPPAFAGLALLTLVATWNLARIPRPDEPRQT